MARKNELVKPEVFTDSDTGLVYEKDPFGGQLHKLINVDDSWEAIAEDNGRVLEWDTEDTLVGMYVGTAMVDLPDEQQKTMPDGTVQTAAELYVFDTYPEGERVSCWATYQLRKAFEEHNVQPKELVLIKKVGERKAKQGAVKIFRIYRRKPEFVESYEG